nr:fibrinogen silencer-binding protein-like [Onthophagus taurus]
MEKRSKNFTSFDKKLLIELVKEHKSIIENKKTDSSTNMEKKQAWDILTEQFNQNSQSGTRNAKQLKDLYGFIKRNAKKHNSADKERNDFRKNKEDGETIELKMKILREEFEQAKLKTLIMKAQLEREQLEVEKIKNELKK